MAKWTGSQFGVSANGVKNITGTDYSRTVTSDSTAATKDEIVGMADSLATQKGQVTMGNSRATKKEG